MSPPKLALNLGNPWESMSYRELQPRSLLAQLIPNALLLAFSRNIMVNQQTRNSKLISWFSRVTLFYPCGRFFRAGQDSKVSEQSQNKHIICAVEHNQKTFRMAHAAARSARSWALAALAALLCGSNAFAGSHEGHREVFWAPNIPGKSWKNHGKHKKNKALVHYSPH